MRLCFIAVTLFAAVHWLSGGHRAGQVLAECVGLFAVWGFIGFVLWDAKRQDDKDWWEE